MSDDNLVDDHDDDVDVDVYSACYNLDSYARPCVTHSVAKAKLWFDWGLAWTFAYNHDEAVSCFRRAATLDSNGFPLAYWGIAYAIGPNYNKPWQAFEEDEKDGAKKTARQALQKATALSSSAVEQALIHALAQRYNTNDNCTEDGFSASNDAFAKAMRQVYQTYPTDLDAICVFVEALLNRTPWQLWDLTTGLPAKGANTLEAKNVLEQAFTTIPSAWQHTGLLHMYIHLMEMSPTPERALSHGDALYQIAHDAGHLRHMASHIDVLTGDYATVVARNQVAVQADRKFLEHAGANNFYTLYRCHNYHFIVYGALFLAQPAPALQAAQELIDTLPSELLQRSPDWFEVSKHIHAEYMYFFFYSLYFFVFFLTCTRSAQSFVATKQHVLVRFGKWQEILDQPLPDNAQLYAVTTATMCYARAVALANLKKDAQAAQNEFLTALEQVPASRMLFNNTARVILAVAEQMMRGEVAYHAGNVKAGLQHLRQAVQLDDNLPYDEPWGWMQPVRHALGALLLEQGQWDEAEAVYRADLGLDDTLPRACQHFNNVWSLHGLYECLKRRGETTESKHVKLQLDKAMARAQVPIRASCLCRQKKTE